MLLLMNTHAMNIATTINLFVSFKMLMMIDAFFLCEICVLDSSRVFYECNRRFHFVIFIENENSERQ